MTDTKPFNHGEEGTHSVCNKHNIGGESVCCECSGKDDCGDITMTYTQKILEEFDKKFVKDCGPDIEPIFIDAIGSVGPIRQFLTTKIKQVIAEERERVRDQYKNLKPIDTAPKDGTTIEALYPDGTLTDIFWSERPVCMLGTVNGGFPEGWATGGRDTDYNLPMDTPIMWIDILASLDKPLTKKD